MTKDKCQSELSLLSNIKSSSHLITLSKKISNGKLKSKLTRYYIS